MNGKLTEMGHRSMFSQAGAHSGTFHNGKVATIQEQALDIGIGRDKTEPRPVQWFQKTFTFEV